MRFYKKMSRQQWKFDIFLVIFFSNHCYFRLDMRTKFYYLNVV